jgi:hypothetical protein
MSNDYDDDEVTRRVVPPPTPDDDIKADLFFVEGRETISKYYENKDYRGLRREVELAIANYYEIYNNFTNEEVFHDRDVFRENAINNGIYVEKKIKEIFALYNEISEKEEFKEITDKIEDFLKDVNVTVNFADILIKSSVGGESNLTKILIPSTTLKNLEKIFDKHDNRKDSIEKLDKALTLFELKKFDDSEEYKFLKELNVKLKENKPKKVKVKKVKVSKVDEVMKFIKETKTVPKNLDLENLEKYKILSSHLEFKEQISKIFYASEEQVLENISLKITEKVMKGEKMNFNLLNKMLIKEQISGISYEKLKSNKKNINEYIDKLKETCYLQSVKYKKENSWKYKFELLVLAASLTALGVVVSNNKLNVKVPEYVNTNTEMTRQLYEDKRDAIEKMEKDVLNSISNRKNTLNKHSSMIKEVKDERIKKIKNKGKEWNQKRKKILEILKN